MDFEPKVFKDLPPGTPPGPGDTAITAAELNDRIQAGIVEGITTAENAQTTAEQAMSMATAASGTAAGKYTKPAGGIPASDLAAVPTVLSNFTVANTAKLRGSLAKAILGTGFSTHVVIGDSLSSAFDGAAFDFPGSWWRRVWRALVTSGVPSAGTGRVAITDAAASGDYGHPISPYDPRISVSGAWDNYGFALSSTASGQSVTFTSETSGTVVEVLWLMQAGGGDFTVTIDDEDPVTVTGSDGGTWERTVYRVDGLDDTPHAVTVTTSAANVIVLGFQVGYDAGLRFDNLGVKYGISALEWDTDANDLGPGKLTQTYSSDADVIWIALGANDLGYGGPTGVADALAAIENIRGKFPDADFILIIEPENVDLAGYGVFVTGMRALSASLDVPLIDLSVRYGTTADIAAAGILGPDATHLNAVGQSDWASVVLDALRAIGPNAVS